MKLLDAQVTNFRSVDDSEVFSLDETVTCLVGKNEAGKSAVLTALAALNPHPATPVFLDRERDYPRRHLLEYATRHPKDGAIAVTTNWALDDNEVQLVEQLFGKDVFKKKVAQIERRYGATNPSWSFDLNLEKAFEHIFSQLKLDAAEKAPLRNLPYTKDIIAKLESLEAATDKQTRLLALLRSYGSVTEEVIKQLTPYFPRFMYFSNYDRMDGAVQIEQLQSLVQSGQIDAEQYRGQRLFRDFFEYAKVPLDSILAETRYESFDAKLQAASNQITDQILEYWTQNPDLEVRVKIEAARTGDVPPFNQGTIARARVHNQLHKVDTPFSERSAGFIWFFSFLVKFALVQHDKQPVILLLDEPGLTLHGKAQADLLRFFDEKLAPHHQIIYSTHSPFMVASDRLHSARIVEDRVELKGTRRVPIGTKVKSDVLSLDRDTLFPLQGALGYEITQTLFVGKHTLLVEGPSDILYLKAFSAALVSKSGEGLDPRWTICPSGGLGNVRSFVALFSGNKIEVAILTDLADGQKGELKRIRELEVFKGSERVLVLPDFTGKGESDIEDIFDTGLFADLLNACYGLKGEKLVTAESLEVADASTTRLVKKAEALFRTATYSDINFDHFAPANWLIQNPAFFDGERTGLSQTLDRAKQLISKLNDII